MIPKADILDLAKLQELQPTTVEKDYVLGWLLYAIAQHPRLSHWVFKGGTCLKKCFFETYRFSEDLDFTIPADEAIDDDAIKKALTEIAEWAENAAGIQFPRDGIEVEGYDNKRNKRAYQGKVTYVGPLSLPRRQLQRIEFDLTQDEIIVETPAPRAVHHGYTDALDPSPSVACYSINEVLAEKTRALYERQGRARDLYDLVHLSRNFREKINPTAAVSVARKKFSFKALPEPTVDSIVARVDADVLRTNWTDQLGHQLPHLPPVEPFLGEMRDAIAWWLQPAVASAPLTPIPSTGAEEVIPRQYFPPAAQPAHRLGSGESLGRAAPAINAGYDTMEHIRYGARNHLCVRVVYHGVPRIVEPYSLRHARTGNTLLYVWEIQRGGYPGGGIKAFKVREIRSAEATAQPFAPRYFIEL